MQGTVYVEDVIIINFLTSFVICALTTKGLKLSISKIRFFVCIFLCVATSITAGLISINNYIFMLIKFILGFFLSSILNNKKTIKSYFICYFCFMFNTFLMGGICYAILLFSGQNIMLNNINSNIIVAVVLLSSILYYFVCSKLLKVFYAKQHIQKYCYNVKITLNNKTEIVTGFLDTGNNLTFNNLPVCIISYITATKFFKDITLMEIMLKKVIIANSHYIQYSTVSGQGSMLVFAPQKLEIKLQTNYIDFSNCYVGISLKEVSSSNSYSILLNSKLL